MLKKNILSFSLISVCFSLFIVAVFSQPPDGKPISRKEKLGQSKERLEELYQQWLGLDRGHYERLDTELTKKVDKSPKGEFETTKEFEKRLEKASQLEEEFEKEILKERRKISNSLNLQMNQIMSEVYDFPFVMRLGTYNADTEKFPIFVAPDEEQEEINVPLAEAKEFKANADKFKTLGKFSILLDENGKAKIYFVSGEVILNGKSYPITPHNMDVERSMQLLYGNYDQVKKRAVWNYIFGNSELKEYLEKDSPKIVETVQSKFDSERVYVFYKHKLSAIPVFHKKYKENGVNKFVLVAGSVKYREDGEEPEFGSECHACGVDISVAYFVQKGGFWKLESANRHIGNYGGQYGQPPEVSLIKIGQEKKALIFSDYWFGQGVEYTILNYIADIDGTIKQILRFEKDYDSSGVGEINEFSQNTTTKVDYLSGKNSDYFDIKVVTTGQKGTKIGERFVLKSISEMVIYSFVDGTYQSVKLPKL